MKIKNALITVGILLLALFLASCGSDDNVPTPTPAELVKKASQTNPYESMSFTGDFNGTANLEIKGPAGIATDGEKSLTFTFTGETPTNVTDSKNPKVNFSVNDKFSLTNDAKFNYITVEGYKPLRQKNEALTSKESNQLGIQVPQADQIKQYQKLFSGLQDTVSKGATVSEGEPVDDLETWKMEINLEDIDYRQALTEYSKAITEAFNQEGLGGGDMDKEVNKAIDDISDKDLDTAKELLSKLNIDVSFYKDSGMVAAYSISVDLDKIDIEKLMDDDKAEVSDDSQLGFSLNYEVSYSDQPFEINVPDNAINFDSPAGQKEFGKIIQEYIPQLGGLVGPNPGLNMQQGSGFAG